MMPFMGQTPLRGMMRPLAAMRFGVAPAGGLALLLGERLLPGGALSPYLTGLGVLLVLGALVLELLELHKNKSWQTPSMGALGPLIPHVLFALAVGLYFAAAALKNSPLGMVDWYSLAGWGWMLCLLGGALLFCFTSLARASQNRLPHRDLRRQGYAASAGISLALLLTLLVTLNFIFSKLPWEWNVAYFKTTRASAATREVVEGLQDRVEVTAFFTANSPVADLLRGYFRGLGDLDGKDGNSANSANFHARFADADLNPTLAEQFKARGNGWVILRRGESTQKMFVGETIARARGALRKFDSSFFGKLVEISREKQTAYMTVGHGERNEKTRRGGKQGIGFGKFQTLLRSRNYQTKTLGLSEGSGENIPADAALVIIAAPSEPFLPLELEALQRYLDGGGRLLVFLEPRETEEVPGASGSVKSGASPASLNDLLSSYGIRYRAVSQANDRMYGRRTFTKADHSLLVTVGYQNHASVSRLRQAANQYPIFLLGSGTLEKGTPKPGLSLKMTIRGMPGTWGDLNRNFIFDSKIEKRGIPGLAMAVEPAKKTKKRGAKNDTSPPAKGPTILAFADADIASDLLIRNRANQIVMESALSWLINPEQTTAAYPSSEEDVKIVHAKGDDWLWFYLPVAGVPCLVLGLGFWRVRTRRKSTGGSDE